MMRSLLFPVALALLRKMTVVESRRWTDIDTYHSVVGEVDIEGDAKMMSVFQEMDPLFTYPDPTFQPTFSPTLRPSTNRPSSSPSESPTISVKPTFRPSAGPTIKPSPLPTAEPTTAQPSDKPSHSPSFSPSESPSISTRPSTVPSESPTSAEPSPRPTSRPTLPPTSRPTEDPFPYNPAPTNPPRGYFDYDQSPTALYGPGQPKEVYHNSSTNRIEFFNNGWKHRWQAPNDWYWHEFDAREYSNPQDTYYGWLAFRNPANWNFCQSVGLQSPVDVTGNGAFCFEYHQIRTTRGDVTYDQLKPVIESNKLRMIIPRRPCLNVDSGLDDSQPECNTPRPPGADLAHWWAGKADATHIDLKIPSEHLLEGVRYDMEFQIWHLHVFKRRNPVMSLMVTAKAGGYNHQFQRLLNLWQDVWSQDIQGCRSRRLEYVQEGIDMEEDMVDPDDYAHHVERFARYSNNDYDYNNNENNNAAAADNSDGEDDGRELASSSRFNPYHEDFLKTIYFLGYDGSLTEPPCGQWVSWRIMDVPFEVSFTQLFQAKNLIFNHVDQNCRRTGVHTQGPNHSVARPLQDTFNRPIHKCTSKDYVSDEMKRLWISQGKSPQVPGQHLQM